MELDDNKNSNGLVPEEEYQGEETAQTASDDLEEMKTPGDIPKNEFTDEQEKDEAEQANEKAEEAEGEIELSGAESENLHESDTSSEKLQQAQEEEGATAQEEYDGPRCVSCGTPVSAGTEYCLKCSYLSRKVSFKAGGFIAAVFMLIFSIVSIALLVPSIDIYSKVLEGDILQRQNRYGAALESYNAADETALKYNEGINKAFGSENAVYYSSGKKAVIEKIKATQIYAGTMEAGKLIETYFDEGKAPAEIKDIEARYQKIMPSFTAVQKIFSDYYYDYWNAMYYGTEFTGEVSYEEFSKKLDDAAAKNPDYIEYVVEYFRFCAASMTSEDEQLQIKNILKVKELAPEEHWLYCNELMQLYFSTGSYDKTVDIADIAIKNNYQTATAYIFKAEALFSSGRYEECVKTVEQDIAENSNKAATYVYKIRSLYQMGKKDEAFKFCETLYKGEDTDSSYYAIKAELHRMDKDYEKALSTCEEGLKLDDENIELYRQQAITYLLKEDATSAKTALNKAYDLGATLELIHTIAVYSIIADDESWYEEVEQMLAANNLEMPQTILDFKAGKLTLEDIYIDGKGDVS